MKFGSHRVINDLGRVSISANLQVAAISLAILVNFRRTKLVFKLQQEFYRSNPYMKFGKTLIKKNEVVDTDRRWPFFFFWPSCYVRQIKKRIQTFIFLSFGDMGFIVEH